MPVCPNCEYEYIEGIVICPDCNTPLVNSSELKKYPDLSEEDWVLVYTSFSEIDVDMLKENLVSAGIAASVLSQKDSNFPVPGDLSKIKLMVKKGDVQTALELIQEIMPTCPSCKYEYVKGITICPNCHEVLVDSDRLKSLSELSGGEEWNPVFVSQEELEIDSLVKRIENYVSNFNNLEMEEEIKLPNDLVIKSTRDIPLFKLMSKKVNLFESVDLITNLVRGNISIEEDADE